MNSGPALAPRRTLRALFETFVPEAAELDEGGWLDLERAVEAALERRTRSERRLARLLVGGLAWTARLRFGRSLASVPAHRREAWLLSLQDSRWLPVRRGIWSLRTLAFLGYYGTDRGRRAVGYGASPDGWAGRR